MIFDMQLDRPFLVVTPTLDGDVLGILARAEAEFTPPRVHALLGEYSVDGVRKALVRLAAQGVVHRRTAGNAVLYALNRKHIAAPAVIAIAQLRDSFVQKLREEIERWAVACEYAALFGSAARGGMRPDSDIDIFVVRRDLVAFDDDGWRVQVDALTSEVTNWTGNDARVLEYSKEELEQGFRGNDRVLEEILRDGIHVAGVPEVLRRARREVR